MEDTLFTLLMYEVAEGEGELALEENARLQQDPMAAVPEETVRQCKKILRQRFSKKNRQTVGRVAGKALHRVAVAVLVIVVLLTTAFAVFPTFRTNALNIITQVFEDHTNFTFEDSGGTSDYEIEPRWLPEGFSFEREDPLPDNNCKIYTNEDNDTLYIEKMRVSNQNIALDTEGATMEPVMIQNHQGTLINKNGNIRLIWNVRGKNLVVVITSENVSATDVLTVARNLP